jgi:hypothetical protein
VLYDTIGDGEECCVLLQLSCAERFVTLGVESLDHGLNDLTRLVCHLAKLLQRLCCSCAPCTGHKVPFNGFQTFGLRRHCCLSGS